MARPQRLGLLPTWWFWRELEDKHPLWGGLVGGLLGLLGVCVGGVLLDLLGLPLALPIAPFLPFLGLGLMERGLRHLVIRRRKQRAAQLQRALTHNDHEGL